MSDKTTLISNIEKSAIQISKIKVKEGASLYEGKIILFYHTDFNSSKKKTKQLKAKDAGVLGCVLVKEQDVVEPGKGLYTYKSGCSHSTVINDLCAECGIDLQKDDKGPSGGGASVPMVHTIPSLKVSHEQAQILGRADETRLIKDRKLVLLVDLDQTLIHTTNDNIPPNIKDIHHFQLNGPRSPWYHTRLRPGTHQFLASISKWFELHICTFGSRNYAHQIAHFLDAQGKYFSSRILSRDECFDFHSKTANLKALFPCGDNMVCIIDDREDVWNYAMNLIHVKPYHFFRHTGDINAPPGLNKSDNDALEEGYTFAQLAKGVSIKKSNAKASSSINNSSSIQNEQENNINNTSVSSEGETKKRKRKEVEVEEKLTNNSVKRKQDNENEEEKGNNEEIKTLPTDNKESDKTKTTVSPTAPPGVRVEKELEVLEEKIAKANREIVSIVKIVRSNSTEQDIPVIDIQDNGSSNNTEYRPSLTTKPDEYVPSSTQNMDDDIQYIPSSTEYVPSATEKSDEYVPSETEKSDDIQYIPSSTSKKKGDENQIEEYVPSMTDKSDTIKYIPSKEIDNDVKYVPSMTDKSDAYVPSSINLEESHEYVPSSTNKSDEKHEYVPSSTQKMDDIEYVPSSTTNSDAKLEYVPTSTENSEEISEYVPSSTNKIEETVGYVPSNTKMTEEIGEYVPSSTEKSEEIKEYVPTSTEKLDLPEYVPTSTQILDEKSEYVPSSTNKSDQTEYVPSSTEKSDQSLEYIPSSTNNTSLDQNISMDTSSLVRLDDGYSPSKTSPLEEYVPIANPSSTVIEYTPSKTEEYTPTPMEVEYVPPGIRNSIDYTPTPTSIDDTNEHTKHQIDSVKPNGELKGKIPEEQSVDELSAEGIKTVVNGGNGNSSTDLVEVEEVDDYLLYLEEILKHIHQKFYATFDQTKKETSQREQRSIPDLKTIIPNMRSVVLSGCHLVFSGVVPSKMKLEENKAYSVARALGADVSDRITMGTTHLVAVRPGTAKVNEAKRRKDILVVTLDWLWMCAERWERVDERLFPVVSTQSSSSRNPPAHCASPPHPPPSPPPQQQHQQQFSDSINPLMALSSEDLANMDREVEDIFNESDDDDDDDDDDEEEEGENEDNDEGENKKEVVSQDSKKRKRSHSTNSSSSGNSSTSVESLSGDRKGWASPQSILDRREQRNKRKKKRREKEERGEEKEKGVGGERKRRREKAGEEEDEDQSGALDNRTNNISNINSNKKTPLASTKVIISPSGAGGDLEKGLLESDLDLESSDDEEVNDTKDGLESDSETIGSKFRRAAVLPSDVEFDLESSQDGEEEEEGEEWSKMGAALEKEFGF